MTPEQLAERAAWTGPCDGGIVTNVTDGSVEWLDDNYGSMGVGLRDDAQVTPVVGDRVKFYGGFGHTVRGMDVNGEPSWFRTEAEVEADRAAEKARRRQQQRDDFARDKAKLDAQYAALPKNFQRRISRFRDADLTRLPDDPDALPWRIEYEAYEMSACVDAVKIAAWLTAQDDEPQAAYERFRELSWKAAIPDLFDGHSGNSFGFAMRLGYWHATDPKMVVKEHGALVPLVGCVAYGCTHSALTTETP